MSGLTAGLGSPVGTVIGKVESSLGRNFRRTSQKETPLCCHEWLSCPEQTVSQNIPRFRALALENHEVRE